MKNRIISISVTLLSLVLNFGTVARAQTSVEENPVVRGALDEMFEDLDKTKVPTGYLLDYAMDLVELSDYDGTELTDSNYVNRALFVDILRSVRSAAVNASASVAIPSAAVESSYPIIVGASVDVSIAAFKYNYIVANALEDGLIEYDEASQKVSDAWKGGTWQNPYGETHVLAFAPVSSVIQSKDVTYNFLSNLLYKNETINELYFDAGDGNGYRKISAGAVVNANYSGNGKKELRLKAVTGSGKVLEAHSAVYVAQPDPDIKGMGVASGKFLSSEDMNEVWNGISVSAGVSCYAHDGVSLKKPFIVVEGFEPLELEQMIDGNTDKFGYNTYYEFADIFYGGDVPTSLKNEYDLVYIDWYNSTEDIRANAALFMKILRKINQMKADAGSTEKNVVMGQSMGGLVARYALRTMECNGEEHETATYISQDSPHLGANVPLGALYFVHQLMSFVHGYDKLADMGDMFLHGMLSEGEEVVYNVMHSMAARQMLVNYVDPSGNLDNSVHNEWQEELEQLGFPEGDEGTKIQNLAIVNGGVCDMSLVYNKYLAYADGYAQPSFFVSLVATFVPDRIFENWDLSALSDVVFFIGESRLNLQIRLNPLSAAVAGQPVSSFKFWYSKKFLWWEVRNITLFSSEKYASGTNGMYYDDFPGSYFPLSQAKNILPEYRDIGEDCYLWSINGSGSVGSYSLTFGMTDKIMFIPTASALAIKGDLSSSDYMRNYYTDFPEPEEETGFDAYYLFSESTEHIRWNKDMFDWIADCLEGEVSGPEYVGEEEAQYSLVGSDKPVVWSTSSNAIATIDNTGKLTPQSSGVVKVIAESVDGGSLYRKTKEVMVSYAPTILLDYSYSHESGFSFVAECAKAEEQSRLDKAVDEGYLKYEWSLKVDDDDMETKYSTSNRMNYVPETDARVTVIVRIVDNEENVSSHKHLSFDLRAPFVPNYSYAIVNSEKEIYFVKSDETYDAGRLSEDYTVALRDIASGQLPSDLLLGGDCYLWDGRAYEKGTRHGVAPYYEWSFDFFDSDGFLNAVQMVGSKVIIGRPIGGIGTVIGDEQELVTEGYSFALRICNSAQRNLQKIPFSVIYKEEFPEESSHVIIGDEWNPIGDFNDNPPGFKP